jgi:hypothetical protein
VKRDRNIHGLFILSTKAAENGSPTWAIREVHYSRSSRAMRAIESTESGNASVGSRADASHQRHRLHAQLSASSILALIWRSVLKAFQIRHQTFGIRINAGAICHCRLRGDNPGRMYSA